MNSQHRPKVIVGVARRQSDVVVTTAIDLARHFGADLVCASVNEGGHMVGESADGSVTSMSFNPDLVDEVEETFNGDLKKNLDRILNGAGVEWSVRALAGDPAHAISHLADTIDATMIVVGTREESMRGNLHEFFNGSVAVHLAHNQHRPVVVVPLAPVPFGHALAWDEG
jgi:nucleotide-binding universal stress UspA family protein